MPPDRVIRVASFYNDFIDAIDKVLPAMAENSYMIWTLGNRRVGGREIPNDAILSELLSKRNVILVTEIQRTILFKRMPHKNKIAQTMRTEKILVFKKVSQKDGA
jgi:site-specific DNA-methyltransferase (cytosine-N4-specific)